VDQGRVESLLEYRHGRHAGNRKTRGQYLDELSGILFADTYIGLLSDPKHQYVDRQFRA
jgi:hypothetical protein